MKTKTIIFGLAVAILSVISLTKTQAQSIDQSFVAVVPDAQSDMIKVIFNYNNGHDVEVKFIDADGLILKDRIKASAYGDGFAKKYEVNRHEDFLLEVNNPEFTVTYLMKNNPEGQWVAEFQKATQFRTIASR